MNHGLAVAVLVVLARSAVAASLGTPPMATPPGITLQDELMQNPAVLLLLPQKVEPRFSDAAGMTLYTYEKDATPDVSVCNDQCAKAWPPVRPEANAKPAAHWSIVKRSDGTAQWAYLGKPLYRSAKDIAWGDTEGAGAEDHAWRIARPRWSETVSLPPGFALRQIAQAPGQVLTAANGTALYTFSGDVTRDGILCAGPCDATFIPHLAPQAARATGDFGITDRTDGLRQWTFRGQPLYTFSGDVEPTDVNGAGVDKRYAVALLVKYFVPAEIALRSDQRFGGIWTDKSGMTLYARETARYPASGAHHARGGTQGLFQEGRAVGIDACFVGDAIQCETSFRPLLAGPGARPSGFWTLYERPGGAKQWAYQGYALYTYVGDAKPGDMHANDLFDIMVNDSTARAAPARFQLGLYWRISAP